MIAILALLKLIKTKIKNKFYKNEPNIFATLSEEDLYENIRKLAVNSRVVEKVGVGVNVRHLKRNINKTYKSLIKKYDSHKELLPFEIYIYENYYFIQKAINNIKKVDFGTLPSLNNETRIITLARFIVNSSRDNFSFENVKNIIEIYNSFTPLYVEELFYLKEALIFAICEKINHICLKSQHYNEVFELAINDKFIDSLAYSDAYVNEYLRLHGINKIDIGRYNLRADIAKISFNTNISFNEDCISYCLNSLRIVEDDFMINDIICLSVSYKKLAQIGEFEHMSLDTKFYYLRQVQKLSLKINCSEITLIENAIDISNETKLDIGAIFSTYTNAIKQKVRCNTTIYKQNKTEDKLYYGVIYIVDIVLSAIIAIYLTNTLYALLWWLLLQLCLMEPIKFIGEMILNKLYKTRVIAKMDYNNVDSDHSTIVIMSHYVESKVDIDKAFYQLNSIREANEIENIYFTLLFDLPKSKIENDESILILIDYIKTKSNLILQTNSSVFVRKRTLINDEYVPYGRKRGAINCFNRAVLSNDFSDFGYIYNKFNATIKYAVLLDGDSLTLPGGILSCVNTIRHPMNKKYAILAFENKYNAYSIKSYYAERYRNSSYISIYPDNANTYYKAFEKSIFCGKGIYEIERYNEIVTAALGNDEILSHDIIEGAFLNAGSLNESIYEDAPNSILSDYSRTLRWKIGDIKLFKYIFSKNSNGIKIDNFYLNIIILNIISIFYPIGYLTFLIAALCSQQISVKVAFFIIFTIQYLLSNIMNLRGVGHVRFKYLFNQFLDTTYRIIEKFFMLPLYAWQGLVAIFSILFKKKKFKWKPFAFVQSESGYVKHLKLFLPSILLMTFIAVCSINVFLLLYTLAYILACHVLFSLSFDNNPKISIDEKDKDYLKEIAMKTYQYFVECKGKTGLIADNIQIKGGLGLNNMTSPTNIGFQLLSHKSAYELGIIDKTTYVFNVNYILTTIDGLKKWNGHLYNWYYIDDGKCCEPRYVSSVDSGNFIAALYVVKRDLDDYGANLASKIIRETNFDKLFDSEKNLFFIGYNESAQKYEGHYDIIMSEALILSFIYAKTCKNIINWQSLGRYYSGNLDNTLLSWNGSMFEYMMPNIFFEPSKKSELYFTLKNAAKLQMKNSCHGLFGVSESGYYCFNNDYRFQYKAFGVNSLALKSEVDVCVLSPYSSFLAIKYNHKYISNLKHLKTLGLGGKFGFYEAIDFSSNEPKVVESFMAHHQGMSLCAIANYLVSGCITDYFMNDYAFNCTKLILTHDIDKNYHTKKITRECVYMYNKLQNVIREGKSDMIKWNILSNGITTYASDSRGNSIITYKNKNVNRIYKNRNRDFGEYYYIVDENKNILSPFSVPLNTCKNTFSYTNKETKYISNDKNVELNIRVDDVSNTIVKCLTVFNNSEKDKKYKIYGYMDLCLNDYYADISHRSYNNLFIKTEYCEECNTVTAIKRDPLSDDILALSYTVKGLKIKPITNKYAFIGRNKNETCPIILNDSPVLDEINVPLLGDVLEPCIGYKGDFLLKSGEKIEIIYTIQLEENKYKLYDKIMNNYINNTYLQVLNNSNFDFNKNYKYTLNETHYCLIDAIMNYSFYDSYPVKKLKSDNINIDFLNVDGVNVYIDAEEEGVEKLSTIAIACKKCNLAQVKSKLIVIYREFDRYNKKGLRKIESIINEIGCDFIAIDKQVLDHDTLCTIKNELLSYLDLASYVYEKRISVDKTNFCSKSDTLYYKSLKSGEGYFIGEDAYLIKPINYNTMAPYTNIIALEKGGFITTENGGGFTFLENSREDKITEWKNEPVENSGSEKIFAIYSENVYRLNSFNEGETNVIQGVGYTLFDEKINKNIVVKTVISPMSNGNEKLYYVYLENKSLKRIFIDVGIELDLALGWIANNFNIKSKINDNVVCAHNCLSGKKVYIKCSHPIKLIENQNVFHANNEFEYNIDFIYEKPSSKPYICALACVEMSELSKCELSFILSQNEEKNNHQNTINNARNSIDNLSNINKFNLYSAHKSADYLFNKWLLYQVVSSRLNGRCSYYQVGGAYGFRDQLQDCLCMLYVNPEYVKKHILNCATHQYVEGDVMHWWHAPKRGVRTRISDDKLFLVYLTCEYIKITNDTSILSEKACYLISEPLEKSENSRYEDPNIASFSDPLYGHMINALDSAIKTGKNGLVLIGGGDWNDAMDKVGDENNGESVWLSMFAYLCINEMLPYMEQKDRQKYTNIADNLKIAVNSVGFNGKYFNRAIAKDGLVLGSPDREECAIDIISQAFAVISKICDLNRAKVALQECTKLIDEENKIVRLLTPPFTDKSNYGYINKYPEGIRENGGQYTHGAVWYIMALCRIGLKDEAYRIFEMINPIKRCEDTVVTRKYKNEPYVLSADIYDNTKLKGRGGWSFYTGSASWLYKVILEDIIGIVKRENMLYLDINLPKKINKLMIEYKYESTLYVINVEKGNKYQLFYNDVEIENQRYITLDKNANEVRIKVFYL